MTDKVERLAALLFERFGPPIGPFGKDVRKWNDYKHPDQRAVWLGIAQAFLDELDREENIVVEGPISAELH